MKECNTKKAYWYPEPLVVNGSHRRRQWCDLRISPILNYYLNVITNVLYCLRAQSGWVRISSCAIGINGCGKAFDSRGGVYCLSSLEGMLKMTFLFQMRSSPIKDLKNSTPGVLGRGDNQSSSTSLLNRILVFWVRWGYLYGGQASSWLATSWFNIGHV